MITKAISRLTPPARLLVLTGLSVLTMWLGQGCAAVHNDGLARYHSDAAPITQATGPSLVGGGREHWDASELTVPIAETEHHPTYTALEPSYGRTPRSMGAHPTIQSAFDLGDSSSAPFWEGVAAPFHAASDVVLFIPRAIMTPPGTQVASPDTAWERIRPIEVPAADAAGSPASP